MTQNYLPHLAERVLGRPLLIAPSTAETILSILDGRIGGGLAGAASLAPASPDASQFIGTRRRPNGAALARAHGSTALISVIGSLVNRGLWLDANCGLTSYEGLGAQIREATADDTIKGIVLDIDSGGGEATGMFALAAAIREARKSKYVAAVVDDLAASAAYGIASAADEIVISPTSVVGSIGVVMLHLDRSGEMEKKGVSPTFIHAGAHKVDGHPFGPLPESVIADLQRDIEKHYARFLETVAIGRGARLTADAARRTEARTFIGQDAITAGLADRFGTVEDVLASLAARKTTPSNKQKGSTMLPTEANHQTIAQARADERARIRAIVDLPEAQGRQTAAINIALRSDMPVDDVKATLFSMPMEGATSLDAAAASRLLAGGGPEIGANRPAPTSQEEIRAGWKRAMTRASAGRDLSVRG